MYTVHVQYIIIILVHSFRLDSRCADSTRFPGVWWQLSPSFWHHSTTKVNNAHIQYTCTCTVLYILCTNVHVHVQFTCMYRFMYSKDKCACMCLSVPASTTVHVQIHVNLYSKALVLKATLYKYMKLAVL